MDLMYRVPSDETIAVCRITKAVVEEQEDVQVIYHNESKSA